MIYFCERADSHLTALTRVFPEMLIPFSCLLSGPFSVLVLYVLWYMVLNIVFNDFVDFNVLKSSFLP